MAKKAIFITEKVFKSTKTDTFKIFGNRGHFELKQIDKKTKGSKRVLIEAGTTLAEFTIKCENFFKK